MSKPRSIMMYGQSGTTKTTQLYHLAKYILATTGKKLRMVHGDPGGYAPFEDSGMIQRGEVDVFDISFRELALADIRRLSEGYWPRKTKDGKTYFKTDAHCLTSEAQWSEIAGYLVEGMASLGELLKTHISNQRTGVGFKEAWFYEEDGYTLTGLTPGHYDLIQKEVYARHVQGFNTLPIQYLVWTSLVGKGEDKKNNVTAYGPQVVGNASSPRVPTWFMDCLYLSMEKYKDKAGVDREGMVAWFTQHSEVDPLLPGSSGVPYLAKVRIAPELFPKLLEAFPYGFIPLGYKNGVDVLFKYMDKLRGEFQGANVQTGWFCTTCGSRHQIGEGCPKG